MATNQLAIHRPPQNISYRGGVVIVRIEETLEYFLDQYASRDVRVFRYFGTDRVYRCTSAIGAQKIIFFLDLAHENLTKNRTIMQNSAKYMFDNLFHSTSRKYSSFSEYFQVTAKICDVPRRAFALISSEQSQVIAGDLAIKWILRDGDPDMFEDGEEVCRVELPRNEKYRIGDEWQCRLLNMKEYNTDVQLETSATSIFVVEKEGVYDWLAQCNFYQWHNCILVCSHGSPDLNTIAFVQFAQIALEIPVYGLSDLNPSGMRLLHDFFFSQSRSMPERHLRVAVSNLGMRPTQFAHCPRRNDLTDHDNAIIRYLCSPRSKFLEYGNAIEKVHELMLWGYFGIMADLECVGYEQLMGYVHRLYINRHNIGI